jgi:tetratricopeptide (TPR) repeat protein
MKRFFLVLCIIVFCSAAFAQQAVTGLLGLDEALNSAAKAVEAKLARGTEIAVYKIKAAVDEIGEYLCDDLSGIFTNSGRLVQLARETALRAVDAEQDYQKSGLVSDETAVGIGHNISAKVVITGTFDRYADFSQLRIRAVDVRSSALLVSYTGRINNKDAVLANIVSPYNTAPLPQVSENALAALNRGKDFNAEGKIEDAIREFDSAIALDKNLSEAYYNRGLTYFFNREYDRAIADYTQAIRIDPNNIDYFFWRGLTYRYKQDLDKAIMDFSQMIRINPNYTDAFITRGNAYYRKGDYDRAIADYNQAIRLKPNDTNSFILRGDAYRAKDDFNKAIADYNQAIRIDPKKIDVGNWLSKNDNYDETIKLFTNAIRLEPNNSYAYNGRGNAYRDKGDLEKAITDYTQAIRFNPDYANAYNGRGDTYRDKGDLEKAITNYTQAIHLNSDYENAYNNRGDVYYKKGDYDKAIADFEAALRLNPDNLVYRMNLVFARANQAEAR